MEQTRKLKVVLVEDEQRIAQVLKNKIERLAPFCEIVDTAGNGKDGFELISKIKPDIVFTDIRMPMMDGLELTRNLRKHFPDLNIVIVSGYSDFTYAKKAIRYGVFNYLLKPINDDELLSTIEDIRDLYQINNDVMGSHIMFSDNCLIGDNKQYVACAVFSVTLGNICYDNLDAVLYDYYKDIQRQVDWQQLIKRVGLDNTAWIIADEQSKNHINIIVKVKDFGCDVGLIAKDMFNYLQSNVSMDISVNVCYSSRLIDFDDVWPTVQKLRKVISDALVIGQSRLLMLEEQRSQKNQELMDIIKLKINDNSVDFKDLNSVIAFRKETGLIFNYVAKANPTQKLFEKILMFILRKFEFSFKHYDMDIFDDLQIEMNRKICMANNYSEVEQSFINCINVFFDRPDGDKDLEHQEIFDYAEANFTKNISLEKISEMFNYSSSHISRLFKKKTKQSFTRYIISKRILMAKDLIENSDYSFNNIAQMIGYEEGRYFSRVFKLETGMSPSEYKKSKEITT